MPPPTEWASLVVPQGSRGNGPAEPTGRHQLSLLAPRELECLRLYHQRFEQKEIARLLTLSPATVKEYLGNARRKLGVASSAEAARLVADAEATPTSGREPPRREAEDPAPERQDPLLQSDAAAGSEPPRLHDQTFNYQVPEQRNRWVNDLIDLLPLRRGEGRPNDLKIVETLIKIAIATIVTLLAVGLFEAELAPLGRIIFSH